MDSLFYVKTKISDNCEINTAISCDNVFAQCNGCGRELKVDLMDWADLIKTDGIDCIGCAIYCEDCTKKRKTQGTDEMG